MPIILTDDGVRLNYRVDDFVPPWIENKDTVFLHHGFARNMKWWTLIVPDIAKKYRVIRLDARGCGESRIGRKQVTWSGERLCKDVINLLDELGTGKIHWIGESSGGIVGLMFAANYGKRIRSLTLINTPLKFPDEMLRTYSQGYSDPAAAIKTLGFKQWVAQTMNRRIDPSGISQATAWFQTEQSKTPTEVAGAYMRIFQSADFTNRLKEIKVPTLMLMGERNLNVPPEQLTVIRDQILNSKVVIIKDAGAGLVLLQPEQCVHEITAFLSNIG